MRAFLSDRTKRSGTLGIRKHLARREAERILAETEQGSLCVPLAVFSCPLTSPDAELRDALAERLSDVLSE